MGKEIIFYYDIICPYAYLASKLVEKLAQRNNAKLFWRPVLLGGIYKQTKLQEMELPDNKMLHTYSNQKRNVMARDLAMLYNRNNINIHQPKVPDIRTLNAMRLISATPDEEGPLRTNVSHKLFDAIWLHQKDVSDAKVLQEAVNELQWDVNVEKVISDSSVKQKLIENTNEAVNRGAFGVPSLWVNNRLYFGGDRFFLVEQELGNKDAHPERLLSKPLPGVTKAKLTIFFDFSSPWSYMGFKQIPKMLQNVKDVQVEVEWVPILLGGLFMQIGTPGVPMAAMGENKRRYYMKDFEDWLKYRQISNFQFSSNFPIRTILPCRVAIANPDYKLIETIYDAAWSKDLDISNENELHDILTGSGFNADELFKAASSDEIKAKLRENTQRAADAGACGVPSFQVNGGPIIFGQDRLNIVEDMIYGWKFEGHERLRDSKL